MDFFKVEDKITNKVFGAIDINNMIPVMPNNYTKLTFENLDQFREFKNKREKQSYWKLLKKEALLLNEIEISTNAKNLYDLKEKYPNSSIAKRCCDFKKLEQKCLEYNRVD